MLSVHLDNSTRLRFIIQIKCNPSLLTISPIFKIAMGAIVQMYTCWQNCMLTVSLSAASDFHELYYGITTARINIGSKTVR